MKDSLYSTSWYRVKDLRPKLRGHAEIHRHHYRGERWYVARDPASERSHRFSPSAYNVIGLMDGKRTAQELWDLSNEKFGDGAPTQDQFIRLLGQLHAADLLQCDVSPDIAELLERHEKSRRRTWLQQLMSPLFWRFPLFDPERLLRTFDPIVRPLFSVWGALVWFAVVATGVTLAIVHWHDLTENVIDRVLAPENLLLLWLLFPILKALHEFGHAFAVKAYGGEVHEMGIMLLVLTPLPYVDASSASAFRSKRQRVLVGTAGMMVELFLASLALVLWLNVEPGAVRTVLYNLMFIAGVSTLLFNANPLLRFDGYYILSDLLEIPNLRSRSTRYLFYLIERYLFGRREADSPPATPGERRWFFGYSISSFIYRIIIFTGIILFIASKFFFVGVALAVWGGIAWGLLPLGKGLKYIFTSPKLRRVRGRAVAVSAGFAFAVVGLIGVLPMPLRSRAEGVIWVPENAVVRAGTAGTVVRLLAKPGDRVEPDDPLILCKDPFTETQVTVLEAELSELKARHDQARLVDLVRAKMIEEEIAHKEESVARARERVAELTIRSEARGTFVVPQAEDLPDRFVRQGTPLAYVLDLEKLTARVVVSQSEVDLVRRRTRGVEVRLAERIHETLPAVVRREVPAASEDLPSSALGTLGGGDIATDPFDAQGVKAVRKLFQFDVELPVISAVVNVGGRVYVRFDHGWEPLAQRWYRGLRRLFLSRFQV